MTTLDPVIAAARERSLPEVAVVAHELIRVATGFPVVVTDINGNEVLLRLIEPGELATKIANAQREVSERYGIAPPPITFEDITRMCGPLTESIAAPAPTASVRVNDPDSAQGWGEGPSEHWVLRDDSRAEHGTVVFGNAAALMTEARALINVRADKNYDHGYSRVAVFVHLPVEMADTPQVRHLVEVGTPIGVVVTADAQGIPA
jgi:hypothetical protein